MPHILFLARCRYYQLFYVNTTKSLARKTYIHYRHDITSYFSCSHFIIGIFFPGKFGQQQQQNRASQIIFLLSRTKKKVLCHPTFVQFLSIFKCNLLHLLDFTAASKFTSKKLSCHPTENMTVVSFNIRLRINAQGPDSRSCCLTFLAS